MKISKNISLFCALLGAVAASGAPQLSLAQEQPRRAQPVLNLGAKVNLPAQFDAPQFFDALAAATQSRVVAPTPDAQQLAQLNADLGARASTVGDISVAYEKILGYDLSQFAPNSNIIVVRLPDALIYPKSELDPRYAAFLQLLDALSPAQIERMFLQNGLTVQDLTPTQSALYLEARRKNENIKFVLGENETLTDAQVLAQPVKFRFAFQAAVSLTGEEQELESLALFDYGIGLIWNPLVAADTKKFEKYFDQATIAADTAAPAAPAKIAIADLAKAINTPVSIAQTQTTTVGAMLDQIGRASGQTIRFSEDLDAKAWRDKPILISGGNYKAGELTFAVAAGAGLQFGFYNGAPTLSRRAAQQPISQLPTLVEAAQQKLRRLPLASSGLPFDAAMFERGEVDYEELSGAEVFYLYSKLLNENTEGNDQIDLAKFKFRFFNQLLFIGETGDAENPFVTSSLQLW